MSETRELGVVSSPGGSAREHKSPAQSQITAEQLLSEAYEFRQTPLKTPSYKIADLEELHEYQRRKREEYENALRRNRFNFGQWMRYAQFEVEQHDFPRARSVFERALEADSTNVSLWIRYVQTEIKGRNINHARNLLDRATTILPRVDKLWYQYVTVEENLGNIVVVRSIFENWLQWKPGPEVWKHFVEFEERYKELDNCRAIFEKFVLVYPLPDTWILWADFEKIHGDEINVKNVYSLGVNALVDSRRLTAEFLNSWIQWESSKGRSVDVRRLYSFGLKALTGEEITKLQDSYAKFEKKYGDSGSIEESVLNKRKVKYESTLSKNPRDYESWWLYLDLICDPIFRLSATEIEEKYEQAVSNVPAFNDKQDWTVYIYVCLRFATWEELRNKKIDQARSIYSRLLKLVPHKIFTFAKVWIKSAELEIRSGDLTAARKILGRSIGICPNRKILDYYISLETRLKEFDRARLVFNKLVENFPEDFNSWLDYVRFEQQLGDVPRAQAIGRLAVSDDYLEEDAKVRFLNALDPEIASSVELTDHNIKVEREEPVSAKASLTSRFEEG
ncbi:DEKNAAC104676 [Brettanomyces naardenensis]|uniref:Pre-mRNA-splicing factor CLF1 n=1 Tax=Brettanomyces naardenensis TaxID=13370 RepID=A0A448YQY8_BRENA|nr:DEKNAAC104676 [Brettanomyces naardenensis]